MKREQLVHWRAGLLFRGCLTVERADKNVKVQQRQSSAPGIEQHHKTAQAGGQLGGKQLCKDSRSWWTAAGTWVSSMPILSYLTHEHSQQLEGHGSFPCVWYLCDFICSTEKTVTKCRRSSTWPKEDQGSWSMMYDMKLRELVLFSQEKRGLRGDLTEVHNCCLP